MLLKFSFFILLAEICLADHKLDLPAEVTKCHYGQGECIKNAANLLLRKYGAGSSDYGLPPYDPFKLKGFSFSDLNNQPVNFNMYIKQAEVFGLSQFKVDNVVGYEKDIKKSKFEWYGSIPSVKVVGQYKVNGQILVLPIQGEGDFTLIFDNLKGGIKIKPMFEERNGQRFFKIDKVKLHMEPSKLEVNLTNLFNGNKELGDALITTLNTNWKDLWDELSGALLEITENIMKAVLTGFFNTYSYDEVFLPD